MCVVRLINRAHKGGLQGHQVYQAGQWPLLIGNAVRPVQTTLLWENVAHHLVEKGWLVASGMRHGHRVYRVLKHTEEVIHVRRQRIIIPSIVDMLELSWVVCWILELGAIGG